MDNQSQHSALRIIDAAQNRAAEGMRVVEDFARMHKEDSFLSGELKQLRHDLTTTLAPVNSHLLLQARDPATDVGTQITTSTEFQRASLIEIVRSNFSRVLQSLRTMEEYSKFLAEKYNSSIPRQLEQMRYRTYALEKAIVNAMTSANELEQSVIYVLVDGRGSKSEFEKLIYSLVEADVCLIQLRDKSLDDRTLIEYGKLVTELTRSTRTCWLMNDRVDLALLAGADGVHVGQEDLTVHETRQIIGFEKLIGVSTHNPEQARAAEVAGANYIGVGPCFPSSTKRFDDFISPDCIKEVVDQSSIPVFAIGGIGNKNIEQLARLGVTRVAVSRSILGSRDIKFECAQIKKALRPTVNLDSVAGSV